MEHDFKHLLVEFFEDSKLNKRKSESEGRPIYDAVEKVRIRIAGDNKSVHVAFANDLSSVREPGSNRRLAYKELHKGPYEAFKQGQKFIGSGTPLKEAPFLNEAKRKELMALNIFSVEALASLDGANLAKLGMGGRALKDQAEAYIAKAADTSDVTKLAAENADLTARIAQLEAMMNGMTGNREPVQPQENADEGAGDTPSPFADWAEDDIKLWIEENGGAKPHHLTKHPKLVQLADALNAKLAEANKAA